MRVTTTATRFENELREHLQKKIDKLSGDILRGVPVEVYLVRCAELRAVTDLVAELPSIMKKASD